MTLQLTSDHARRLENIAGPLESTPDTLIQEALELFLKDRENLIEAIRLADESAERDGVLTSEQVLARILTRSKAA